MASGGDDNAPLPTSYVPFVNPIVVSAQAAAPAAAAVVADSGALAAGVYAVEVDLGFSAAPAAGKHISLEHRNAANNGNTQQLGLCPGGAAPHIFLERVVVAANERIRAVIGAVAAAAGEVAHASIRLYLLPQ